MTDKKLTSTANSVIIAIWVVQIVVRMLVLTELPWITVTGVRVVSGLAVLAAAFCSFRSRSVLCIIGVAALLLSIGVMFNSWYYTVCLGGTQHAPVLVNYDSQRWWADALYHLGDPAGAQAGPSFGYYGYVLAGVLGIFGPTVDVALLWSMSLILIALLLSARLANRCTSSQRTVTVTMACTAAVCYWLTMGTLILKDAFVIVAILVAANGLVAKGWRLLLWLVPAAVMLALSRPGYNAMLVLGILLVHKPLRFDFITIISIVVCLVAWQLPTLVGMGVDATKVIAGDPSLGVAYDAPNQLALYNITGDYGQLPFYKKLLLLPVSAVVQYLIPFPWNFARDIPFGPSEVWAHVAYPWYIFGFVAVYFLVSQRKHYATPTYRLAVWAVVCWLVPCYLFGGTISRYGLAFVAPAAPAVAATLINYYKSRRFYTIFCIFAVILVSALIVARHLQSSAIA